MQLKKLLQPRTLPVFTIIAGVLGFVLRLILNSTGFDEKGLLMAGHFASTLLFILAALTLAALLILIRPLHSISQYSKLFPASNLSAIGCVLAAVGILFTAIMEIFQRQDLLTIIASVLSVASAVCLIWIGLHRRSGNRPSYILHAVLTVYLMLHLISQFRVWSPEPQLLLYFFPLLSSILLMLTAYQATCLDAQKGSRRWYAFFNQAALFFCCVSLASDSWPFYLTLGLWAGTNLCSMRVYKSRSTESKEA